MLLTLVSFAFVLGVLIFVHELGHFMAAKAVGIGVPRFSIGLGPATPLRFQRGETEYQVAWIPFGGYVKMASREEQEAMAALEGGETTEEYPPEKLFESKPLWARILVISAGVIMNVLFAWIVYSGLLGIYGQPQDPTTTLARVEAARLPPGAEILTTLPAETRIRRVDGVEVATWEAIVEAIAGGEGDLSLELEGRPPVVIVDVDADARRDVARALVPYRPTEIGELIPDRPAERAGLRPGDRIVAIDGEPIGSWDRLVARVEAGVDEELAFVVERDGERLELAVTPAAETVQDAESGELVKAGRIGVVPRLELVRVRVGPLAAVAAGARLTWRDVSLVLASLEGMIRGTISARELGGPILIGQASGQVARRGGVALFAFMAFLSVNLAVLNLLPIPILDGGHLIFLFIEGLRGGRPLPLALRQRLLQFGLVLLFALMAFALVNDVLRVAG